MADFQKDSEGGKIERTTSEDSHLSDQEHIDAFTPEEQKKIIRRVDIRLVTILGFMYCVSLMDRTNLGIVAISGMGYDLVLVGSRYSIITLVFFITYVILQPFATVVLRKVGPRVFLPSIVVLWGITMMCFGFLTTWTQMVGMRLILGVFEAGFFPGAAYLLSCWYPRFDLQKRNAVFYLIGTMASAFAGILAFGFDHMDGLGDLGPTFGQHYGPTEDDPTAPSGILPGIAGWRWIFIMEGILTCIVGFIGALLIADFPEKAANKTRSFALPFLNQKEAEFIVARIEKDRHDVVAMPFSMKHYMECAADLKIWGFASLFGLTTTCTYAIAYFLPQILEGGMGFSIGASQCLIAPPYVAGALWMYFCAVMADKYRIRGPWVIGNALIGFVGLALLGFASNVGARYFGVFLAVSACNANVPCILTYQANNIRGQWKRALASATLVGAGGVGGIIGGTVFRSQDEPAYVPGITTCMIANGLIIIIVMLLDWKFWRANKRADAGGKIIAGLEGFRYTY